MDPISTFLLGCLGGAVCYVLVYLAPIFHHMQSTGEHLFEWTRIRVIGAVGSAIMIIFAAGYVALAFGATKPAEAIAYGISWQAFAKGTGSIGAALTK